MKNMIIAALFTFSQIAFAGPSGVDVKAGNQMSGMLFRENHSLNAGFEANNENNVTDSSGIATVTSTSPISGNYSLAIDATTSGELVKILGKTIKQVGTSCESVFYYTGDATLYKAYVLQGATKVSQELTLSNVGTNVQPVSLIFPCGSGTAPDVTIESTGNGAAIKVDDFYSGMPVNIGTVAQARFFGGMEQAGASGCNYLENTSTSTTDFKDLGTGTGCSAWTIDSGGTGNISAFGTNDHRLIASNLPAGRYSIEYIGQVYTAATGLCNYRLNDGTNTFQNQTITSGSGAGSGNALKFSVQYSTAQTSITFKIQAADNQASGCGLINDTASGTGASWKIYYFPSQAQTVTTQAQAADLLGTVFHTGASTCPANSLPADGTAVSRSTYATLFNKISTTFGTGDGSTTFNVPDMRGVFVRGSGSQTISSITYSGTLGTKQGDQMQGHAHNTSITLQTTPVGGGGGPAAGTTNAAVINYNSSSPISDGVNGTPRTGTETRPANIAMTPCIWTVSNPAPLIPQSVISDSAGVEKICRATIANSGTASFTTQSGCFTNISRDSGSKIITLTMSGFSGAASCNCTPNGNPTIRKCGFSAPTTSTTVTPQISDNSGNGQDQGFEITCVGPR